MAKKIILLLILSFCLIYCNNPKIINYQINTDDSVKKNPLYHNDFAFNASEIYDSTFFLCEYTLSSKQGNIKIHVKRKGIKNSIVDYYVDNKKYSITTLDYTPESCWLKWKNDTAFCVGGSCGTECEVLWIFTLTEAPRMYRK